MQLTPPGAARQQKQVVRKWHLEEKPPSSRWKHRKPGWGLWRHTMLTRLSESLGCRGTARAEPALGLTRGWMDPGEE